MNYIIAAYCWYLPLSIALTIWVANTLFKNGRVFLLEIFHGNHESADALICIYCFAEKENPKKINCGELNWSNCRIKV